MPGLDQPWEESNPWDDEPTQYTPESGEFDLDALLADVAKNIEPPDYVWKDAILGGRNLEIIGSLDESELVFLKIDEQRREELVPVLKAHIEGWEEELLGEQLSPENCREIVRYELGRTLLEQGGFSFFPGFSALPKAL